VHDGPLASVQETLALAEEIETLDATIENLAQATAGVRAALALLALKKRAVAQIEDRKFYAALKSLERLERQASV
jgi:hypothetical protein